MVTDVLEQQLETRHNAKERGEGTVIAVDSIVGLAVSADNPARNGEADEDENDADVAQLLSTMRSSACHLLDIINDLLDLRYSAFIWRPWPLVGPRLLRGQCLCRIYHVLLERLVC